MRGLRIGVVGCLAGAAVFSPSAASTTAAEEPRYFHIKIVSSGSWSVNYGEERKQPGLTTAIGVDGKGSENWRWEIQSVARFAGGQMTVAASVFRLSSRVRNSVVSYTIQMGEVYAKKLCDAPRSSLDATFDGLGRRPRWPFGDWVRGSEWLDRVAVTPAGVEVTFRLASHGCDHGAGEHGLSYYNNIEPFESRIPRGAFNPRFDESYKPPAFRDQVSNGRNHDRSDLNKLHTFSGSSKLTVTIKRISEKTARKRRDSYRKYPKDVS
jgi:hypothetical protein